MCMGDWRFGRFVRTVVTNWTISTSTNLALPANPQRVGLSCNLTASNMAALTWALISVGVNPLAVIPLNDARFHITLLTHGDLVSKAFSVAQGQNATTGAWVEYIVAESMLTEALESLKRQYPGMHY